MMVNEGLPDFLVRLLKARGSLRQRVVGVLGMAFKAESDDPRDSLSYKLAKVLRAEGALVMCTDPYVQDPSLFSLEEVLARAQVLILACPHEVYRNLNLKNRDLVDPWGIFGSCP
jgi:UDP-N-acetyl-D-mannosaminuronic acid dehydrogenase